jgi:hypothetical protein
MALGWLIVNAEFLLVLILGAQVRRRPIRNQRRATAAGENLSESDWLGRRTIAFHLLAISPAVFILFAFTCGL